MFEMPRDRKCPACGKDIYVLSNGNDYCCSDMSCIYGHGAKTVILNKQSAWGDKVKISNEYRQCIVDGKRGLFHGWGNCSQEALVEFEDGSVKKVDPEKIKFVDGSALFNERVWFGVDLASGPDSTVIPEKRKPKASWVVWPGWSGNHDRRIEDAKCSNCGYEHPKVYGRTLSTICPSCKSPMHTDY